MNVVTPDIATAPPAEHGPRPDPTLPAPVRDGEGHLLDSQNAAPVHHAPLITHHSPGVPRSLSVSTTTMPSFKTPVFEGPLDLLLHLIRANQVEITDIPIAEITEQYLAYVELLESLDLAVAGEYVLIAATLIEIKSRLLLPKPPRVVSEDGEGDEADDPRAELVARLLQYQSYQGVVETFQGWEILRRQIFFRGALENTDDYILPVAEGEASPSQLYQALHRLLTEAGVDDQPVTTVTPRKRLSLRLKMAEVARKILVAAPDGVLFDSLFELPCPRYDIVLTFLALLELLKSGRVRYEQARMHAPLWLFAIPDDEEVEKRPKEDEDSAERRMPNTEHQIPAREAA